MKNKALIFLILSGVLFSCQKSVTISETDPYAGGKQSLGIAFTGQYPTPQSASPGESVVFQVKGLLSYKDSFAFYINGEQAQVLDLTDSLITVKVPDDVSSGIATLKVEGQIFFGPRLAIINKVSIDNNFAINIGTNGAINDCYGFSSGFVLAGSFSNFQNKVDWWSPFNNIVLLDNQWNWNQTFQHNSAASGPLYSIAKLSNGQFILAGNFSSYNGYVGFNNITKVNADLTMDTAIVNVVNTTTDPKGGRDTVSRFNGGAPQVPILRAFVTTDDKVIAVGNFRNYGRANYAESNRQGLRLVYTKISSVMRMMKDGSLDTTYGYVATTGNSGVNGVINDAAMLPDGRVILVGLFSSYNGTAVNNIVRLDTSGKVDGTFKAGSGANNQINTVRYNPLTDKLVVTGTFSSFNGQSANGVAVMDGDGQLDASFKLRSIDGGLVNFATALNNGKVVVSGTFNKYDGVTRPGFLILESDGTALQEYNNVGTFQGQIEQVYETKSSLGNPALVLAGYISKFDDQAVGNIVRVEVLN